VAQLSTLGCSTHITFMKTKTSALKNAVATFCFVAIVLLAGYFGSYYLSLCGFQLVPFRDWQANDLWQILCGDAYHSAVGAFAAAVAVYIVARKMRDEKSNAAA